MINILSSNSRHSANHGWLKTAHSISHDTPFGVFRALADDIVAPRTGFGKHPHSDMEIVTLVLSGQLKHEDSTGGSGVIHPGEIQRMTAGTGIVHSEMNGSDTEEVNLLQLWFIPDTRGLMPSYEQITYDQSAMKNSLLPVVSNKKKSDNIAYIHQDVTLYLSELDSSQSINFKQETSRKTFLFVIEGEVTLNGEVKLNKRDSARIIDESELNIYTATDAKFMLIDLA